MKMMKTAGSTAELLLAAAEKLRQDVSRLSFLGRYRWVYNPLDYASAPHAEYTRRYGNSRKRILFLGMNPGPWGMAQTGVPFGEVSAVRDWMQIEEPVGKPAAEHEKRPIEGFACTRSEVSGRRLWGLMQNRFGTAASFFSEHFVMNYCPLVFMEESGKNLTPDKLPAAERKELESVCDAYTEDVVTILAPEFLVGIGGYAEKKLLQIFSSRYADSERESERGSEGGGERSFRIAKILHPSPASPAANRGWAEAAEKQMTASGIW